eukprot:TRINITY_DN476_c0_g2_i15.p2 TRINITY_DN476_c0_g2~~TRINITY_DN476_c0_g2_i15.p2  ORF type:complete len:203 (-),score=50.28 TRINITY_DN476_c0_g2_i15:152-760(-)
MGRNLMEGLSLLTLHSHVELQEEEVDPMEVAVVMGPVVVEAATLEGVVAVVNASNAVKLVTGLGIAPLAAEEGGVIAVAAEVGEVIVTVGVMEEEEVGAGVTEEEVIVTVLGQVTDIPVAVRGVVHLDMTEVDIAIDQVLMIDPVVVAAAGEDLEIIDLISSRKSILMELASLTSFFANRFAVHFSRSLANVPLIAVASLNF